jgi:hypothetical protein
LGPEPRTMPPRSAEGLTDTSVRCRFGRVVRHSDAGPPAGHLRAVAYRMLGSRSDADDAVQEAWLRLRRSDSSGVENLCGWLTTIVARVCLTMLQSRRSRREEPVGAQVPDPNSSNADGVDPEYEALLADSVGLALLVVLDTLAPAERFAFVLHDMFAVPLGVRAHADERAFDPMHEPAVVCVGVHA